METEVGGSELAVPSIPGRGKKRPPSPAAPPSDDVEDLPMSTNSDDGWKFGDSDSEEDEEENQVGCQSHRVFLVPQSAVRPHPSPVFIFVGAHTSETGRYVRRFPVLFIPPAFMASPIRTTGALPLPPVDPTAVARTHGAIPGCGKKRPPSPEAPPSDDGEDSPMSTSDDDWNFGDSGSEEDEEENQGAS
nr:unnamed protein product [Digitaria exilis]